MEVVCLIFLGLERLNIGNSKKKENREETVSLGFNWWYLSPAIFGAIYPME